MIELREMQLLVALARHQHFAKAAEACQISQPAFSMRIRNLEDSLGVSIVRRGNRFLGFTEQGNILVRRARDILEDAKALEQELASTGGYISGHITLGVVPTALAYASKLCAQLHAAHPGIVVRIESTTAALIQQGLETGVLDAGLTYDDAISADLARTDPLYDETYVLLSPQRMVAQGAQTITWRQAAELPMSLLSPQMQNRRIIDQMFDDVGGHPKIVTETNGFVASLIMARDGLAATIVPAVLVDALGDLKGTVVLPLVEPELRKAICLATPHRRPGLPAVEAMRGLIIS